MTEQIMLDLLNPRLSDGERDRRAKVAELAIHNTQKQQHELEQQAVNLIGFSDYILEHITDSRSKGRWLSASELRLLVEDFFARKYPGTKIEPNSRIDNSARITLSEEARRDLGYFVAEARPATRTRMHQSYKPILCLFDPRQTDDVSPDVEFIEPSHPLVQWIRNAYDSFIGWQRSNCRQERPASRLGIMFFPRIGGHSRVSDPMRRWRLAHYVWAMWNP